MSRNHALDGVRGLAALAVAFAHCNLAVMGPAPWAATPGDYVNMTGAEIASSLLYVLFPGHAAVTLFFVLSGHVLWQSFGRRPPGSLLDLPDYLVSRGYRLLPVAVVSAIPFGFLTNASAADLVANMLLLSHSVNGVLWSLQVEAVCSLAIFLGWLLTGGATRRASLLLVAVLALSPAFKGSNFFLFFPAFLLGALIDSVPDRVRLNRSVLIASVLGLVLAHVLIPHTVARHVEMLAAAGVIGCIGKAPLEMLSSRAVLFLGAVSYPFYLAHPVGLLIADRIGREFGPDNPFARMAVLALVSIPVAMALAWLLHAAVERPAMQARPRIRITAFRSRLVAGAAIAERP
jgi:peptidoglycan/LPS O-acetylase OafA/YrhL